MGTYSIKKTFEVSAAHALRLDYDSPCAKLHGHNWKITVFCKAKKLDKNGMVIDFGKIKTLIHDTIDHQNLNEIFPGMTTAEAIAEWIVATVPNCYRATVQETDGNEATYQLDNWTE